uniref:Uncharacterized protein n=1 Tax=Nitophyllum punctatum TaxID=158729 RepID=A0A4D6WWQ2_9FLOR|nr:hypothetical protein [Nitophyllum punctatum]
MVKYWPNKQGIELNNALVKLFINTRKKLKYNLSNITNHYLYTDILNNVFKKYLLNLILQELEELILDILELDLSKNDVQHLNKFFLLDFINKLSKYLKNINKYYHATSYESNQLSSYKYNMCAFEEYEYTTTILLLYLLFGSSAVAKNIFIYNNYYVPYEHIQILFENFILQTSNFIINHLLNQFTSLTQMIFFFKQNDICNYSHISTRSIALFLNNLRWQNFLNKYIDAPKSAYNSSYKVWMISTNGIKNKYIYLHRMYILNRMTKTKISYLLCLEIIDIIIPRIEQFLITTIKYILYIIINLLSNIIILITRIMISYLKK